MKAQENARLEINEFVSCANYEVWIGEDSEPVAYYDTPEKAQARVDLINRPRDPELEAAVAMLQSEGHDEEFDARDFLDSHHPDFND